MDFYACLPSNASPKIYPENKTSNFRTQLSQRLELHGHWQVALMELHYPNTIAQVVQGENHIKVYRPLDSVTTVKRADTGPGYHIMTQYPIVPEDLEPPSIFTSEETYAIHPGFYNSMEDFMVALREALVPLSLLPDHQGRYSMVEMTEDGRIDFQPFKSCLDASYSFSPRLALQLGLEHPGPYRAHTELLGSKPVDLSLGVPPQIYVYMDIIQEQIVGHTRVPLLRTVPAETEAKYGSLTVYRCEQPIYFDLNTKSFDTIEIHLRDHTGELIPFSHGTSNLLVHFKQR